MDGSPPPAAGELHLRPRDCQRHPLILDGFVSDVAPSALRRDRLESTPTAFRRKQCACTFYPVFKEPDPTTRLRRFVGTGSNCAHLDSRLGCLTERAPSAFSSSGEPFNITNRPSDCQPPFSAALRLSARQPTRHRSRWATSAVRLEWRAREGYDGFRRRQVTLGSANIWRRVVRCQPQQTSDSVHRFARRSAGS